MQFNNAYLELLLSNLHRHEVRRDYFEFCLNRDYFYARENTLTHRVLFALFEQFRDNKEFASIREHINTSLFKDEVAAEQLELLFEEMGRKETLAAFEHVSIFEETEILNILKYEPLAV